MTQAKKESGCCRVEAVVSVDERGQVVLPKEVRERMGLIKGDKLALSVMEKNGCPCCIVLTKVEFLGKKIGELVGLK